MLEVDNSATASSTPSNEDTTEAALGAAQLDASVDSGDYEIPVVKHSTKRHAQTVSNIKADARKVLERFLLLTEAARSGNLFQDSSDFDTEHQYAVVNDVYRDQLPTPYQPMGSDESLFDKSWKESGAFKCLPCENSAPIEPDYVDCQAFLATRAKLTGTKSHHALSLFSSSPDAKKLVEHPPKVKSSTKRSIALDEDSSSSTEDYEYTDNELINRKKKNFFRWATERLQHSFRYQGKKTSMASSGKRGIERQDVMSKSDVPLPLPPASTVSAGGLHRNGSEKSKSNSSSTPSESVEHRGAELETLNEEHLQKKAGFTWKKSDSAKDKKKEKDVVSAAEDKGKDGRSMFDGFLRQFRRSSAKLKGKAKHRSRSADTCTIRHLTSDEMRIAQRCAAIRVPSECDSDTATRHTRSRTKDTSTTEHSPTPVLLSDLRLPGRQSNTGSPRHTGCRSNVNSPRLTGRRSNVSSPRLLRPKMNLDGLVSCRPQMPPPGADTLASLSSGQRRIPYTSDALDGDLQDIEALLVHKSSKSFADKSEHEKEELYERIAEQLAAIADRLNLESPRSVRSFDEDKSVAAIASIETVGDDTKDGASLETVIPRPTGDGLAASTTAENPPAPVVAELVHNARDNDVRRFQQLVSDNVGSETGWQAIARMFRLTQSAVQMAGMGTNVAIQIKEMTLNYFEDRFADWIVGQGGWESMVEETNTELDSEVD